MGVRSLAPGRWLTVGDAATLAAKAEVLDDDHAAAVAALDPTPALEAAARELVDAVAADIGRPLALAPGGARAGDGATDVAALVEAAARPVAEDLCLLVPDRGTWVLAAACVCFPSHWRLADKLGSPLAVVHGPVPHYADELAARVDRFLDRLAPGRGSWRRNWLVHTDDRLFAPVPPPPPDPPLGAADAGRRLWLRSERQTLRRLPASGAVVFTIRTQQAPLEVVAARPELRARMAAAVAAWSDALVAYRGGEAVRGPLLAWLHDGLG
jgi:Haem-dependent oxidative N-demethylase, alpha subunit-like